MDSKHVKYLDRCYELALLGKNNVKKNPHVGAVLVYNDRIIGEGYHMKYGEAHAEVNAINSVQSKDKHLIQDSTIYVSLEPCSHFGKTPPCANLIVDSKINRVVIGCQDPFEKVNGKGISILKENNIEVLIANHKKCLLLLRRFVKVSDKKLPYVQLKFAKSKDNYMGSLEKQIAISGKLTARYTHGLRAVSDGILIGTNTAIIDNPSLTTRFHLGESPIRVVLDRTHKIPSTHKLLSDEYPTIIISESIRKNLKARKECILLDFNADDFLLKLLHTLYSKGIYALQVEGGAGLLKSFVKSKLWDEAVVITSSKVLEDGVKAPNINGKLINEMLLKEDVVQTIYPSESNS